MSMDAAPRHRAVVTGGSIGGLCAGVALRAAGWDVDILERAPETLAGRGAGIVVQPDLSELLSVVEGPALATTRCSHRLTLDADGGRGQELPMPQSFTSWEAIHAALRARFPEERYHLASPVADFETTDHGVEVRLVDGTRRTAELHVLADGARSPGRRALLPDTEPSYAGYVAWRGTLDVKSAGLALSSRFVDRFTFCEARDGGHALCYLIPGDGGSVETGSQRLNWIWYEPIDAGPALERVLVDRAGRRRTISVPPGQLAEPIAEALRRRARAQLAPDFAELVEITPDPFVQGIEDLAVERMAFGRTCLLGDAAFVVRPHTAGATAKAAADALVLAAALSASDGDVPAGLDLYERHRLPAGQAMTGRGVALGRRTVAEPSTRGARS